MNTGVNLSVNARPRSQEDTGSRPGGAGLGNGTKVLPAANQESLIKRLPMEGAIVSPARCTCRLQGDDGGERDQVPAPKVASWLLLANK